MSWRPDNISVLWTIRMTHTHTQAIYKKYDVTCSPSQNNFNIVKKKSKL